MSSVVTGFAGLPAFRYGDCSVGGEAPWFKHRVVPAKKVVRYIVADNIERAGVADHLRVHAD
jgi:hypothetical protein